MGLRVATPGAPLSARQEQVLELAAQGWTQGEIAEHLGLSFESVKTHSEVARCKLSAVNTTHAVAVALKLGLIGLAEEAIAPEIGGMV